MNALQELRSETNVLRVQQKWCTSDYMWSKLQAQIENNEGQIAKLKRDCLIKVCDIMDKSISRLNKVFSK